MKMLHTNEGTVIFTDSQGVLQTVSSYKNNLAMILENITRRNNVVIRCRVQLCIADRLAKHEVIRKD